MSWLFIVAYASSLRWTVFEALVASVIFVALHVLMELSTVRIVGSIQFVVVAFVAGWAFDALRQRERLCLEAEAERVEAEVALTEDRVTATRLQEWKPAPRVSWNTGREKGFMQLLRLVVGRNPRRCCDGPSARKTSKVTELGEELQHDLAESEEVLTRELPLLEPIHSWVNDRRIEGSL